MRILLIDTCGTTGSVALALDETCLQRATLAARSASSELLPAIEALLQNAGWRLAQLNCIAVVSGPGSFTGVRVGMSAAKGLCVALNCPIVAVSRLEVLANVSGLLSGYAVLDAGRNEVYVREILTSSENLVPWSDFLSFAPGSPIIVAEESMAGKLRFHDVRVHDIDASSALPAALDRFREGGDDLERVDANYVRSERQMYSSSKVENLVTR